MAANKTIIMIAKSLRFNIQRRNDKFIMDEFTREPLSIKQLIHLNACRLYLNILHLSNVVKPDGISVNHNVLIGIKPVYPISKLKWLKQRNPSVKAWKLWNTIVKGLFNIQDNLTLAPFSRLGEWLYPVSQRNMTHQWYYSLSRQEFTTLDQGKITSYFTYSAYHDSMQINMDSKTELEYLYEDRIPVLLKNHCFRPHHQFKVTACISSSPSTLIKHINALPTWTRTLI